MEEKIIPNYPTYSIRSDGLVKDLRSGTLTNGHSCAGYRKINLLNFDGYNIFLIHRLVALAFIPNPENLLEVDHINRNPADNRVENLRWVNDFQQAQNKGVYKNNKTGHKNIVIEDNYYRVVITRNKRIVCRKRFQNLQDALNFRNSEYGKFL
jgi:hypothetical protein